MRPRPPVQGRGPLSGTGIILVALAATAAALLVPIVSYVHRPPGQDASPLSSRTVATPYGPLSEPDRDFLTRLRLAALWELPAGRQAERKGTTEPVRTAGRHLVRGCTDLDRRVREAAARLGLALPDEPTAQQEQWLGALDAAHGDDYDRRFAGTLRLAAGRLLPLAANVRATTRNSLVRALAGDATTTVLDHIEVLEATGLVDFGALSRDLDAGEGTPSAGTAAPPSAGPGADPGAVVPLTPSGSPAYSLPPAVSSPPPAAP
ncbi:DUF4142 domain-containing protein [Streptomyces sp. NPDC004065]|uniref:DUF4142 domain-containing protein n=1 Tax=Streptomyces sp. NPDC004065 TaxID=3364689 RepID=UPI00384D3796